MPGQSTSPSRSVEAIRCGTYSHIWLLTSRMGRRNYLIAGGSGIGKTSICDELQRRGYHAIHGDRALAYQGDPETGTATYGIKHEQSAIVTAEHHVWHVDTVKALIANHDEAVTFFCGGARNYSKFIDLFDGVFILEADLDTVSRRIDERVALDPSDWGGREEEREIVARLHQTKEDIPKDGIVIDATAPIADVVDEIVRRVRQGDSHNTGA